MYQIILVGYMSRDWSDSMSGLDDIKALENSEYGDLDPVEQEFDENGRLVDPTLSGNKPIDLGMLRASTPTDENGEMIFDPTAPTSWWRYDLVRHVELFFPVWKADGSLLRTERIQLLDDGDGAEIDNSYVMWIPESKWVECMKKWGGTPPLAFGIRVVLEVTGIPSGEEGIVQRIIPWMNLGVLDEPRNKMGIADGKQPARRGLTIHRVTEDLYGERFPGLSDKDKGIWFYDDVIWHERSNVPKPADPTLPVV